MQVLYLSLSWVQWIWRTFLFQTFLLWKFSLSIMWNVMLSHSKMLFQVALWLRIFFLSFSHAHPLLAIPTCFWLIAPAVFICWNCESCWRVGESNGMWSMLNFWTFTPWETYYIFIRGLEFKKLASVSIAWNIYVILVAWKISTFVIIAWNLYIILMAWTNITHSLWVIDARKPGMKKGYWSWRASRSLFY